MKKRFVYILLCVFPVLLHAQEQFSVYFDSNKFQLKKKESDRLEEWIIKNKDSKILSISGYTDEDGSIGLNDTLAQNRVANVYGLIKNRVPIREDFRTISFGKLHEHSPVKAENRKVTIYYLEKKDLAKEDEIVGIKKTEVKPVIKNIQYPDKIVLRHPNGTKEEIILDQDFMQQVTNAKPGEILKLSNLNFYENTFAVLPESRPKMYELLEILKANKVMKVKILGHICCMEGDPRDLSTKRAKAIFIFLQQNGIDKSRLSFEGKGTSLPINPLPEKNEQERAENRRVEILVMEN